MAHVNLILLDDVEHVGLAGEQISVAPGFARNYLIPRKLAAKVTPGALRLIESRKAAIIAKRAKELENAKALAAKLGEVTISISMQATEDDQLFGSVTGRMISEELAKLGYTVEHSRVLLDPPIKALGDFTVEIKLHPEVTAQIKLYVVRG